MMTHVVFGVITLVDDIIGSHEYQLKQMYNTTIVVVDTAVAVYRKPEILQQHLLVIVKAVTEQAKPRLQLAFQQIAGYLRLEPEVLIDSSIVDVATWPSWPLPVMVVLLLVVLLGFWVMMVLYHKKKGVAKPTVGAEPGIELLDEPVAAASTIDKLKTDPAPTATKDDKAVENPKAALHVQTVSDTPAPTSVMAHSTASTKQMLEMFEFKLRLGV